VSGWYAKDGTLLCPDNLFTDNITEWDKKMRYVNGLMGDRDYKIIKQEDLPNGYWVSTVWLGLDHRFGDTTGLPVIFETMVFNHKWGRSMADHDMERYCTEEEARAGHARMVEKWKDKPNEKPDEDPDSYCACSAAAGDDGADGGHTCTSGCKDDGEGQ
jgi:hypothetical protein